MSTETTIAERVEAALRDLDEYGGQVSHPDAQYNPAALAVLSAANTLRDALAEVTRTVSTVEFTVDCPKCGEPAAAGNALFADWEPGKPLVIDLEMAASQVDFTCTDPECGTRCYAGDYEVLTDDDLGGDDD